MRVVVGQVPDQLIAGFGCRLGQLELFAQQQQQVGGVSRTGSGIIRPTMNREWAAVITNAGINAFEPSSGGIIPHRHHPSNPNLSGWPRFRPSLWPRFQASSTRTSADEASRSPTPRGRADDDIDDRAITTRSTE